MFVPVYSYLTPCKKSIEELFGKIQKSFFLSKKLLGNVQRHVLPLAYNSRTRVFPDMRFLQKIDINKIYLNLQNEKHRWSHF